jgi:hypothetical protein
VVLDVARQLALRLPRFTEAELKAFGGAGEQSLYAEFFSRGRPVTGERAAVRFVVVLVFWWLCVCVCVC